MARPVIGLAIFHGMLPCQQKRSVTCVLANTYAPSLLGERQRLRLRRMPSLTSQTHAITKG